MYDGVVQHEGWVELINSVLMIVFRRCGAMRYFTQQNKFIKGSDGSSLLDLLRLAPDFRRRLAFFGWQWPWPSLVQRVFVAAFFS
jgi:hypothetical protein